MSIIDKMEKESQPDIKAEDLGNISDLGRQLAELEEKIRLEEEHLKSLKDDYRKINEDLLPNKLRELGVSEFKLADGTSMSIQQYYSARITPDNRDVCFHWLENNGLGDIIKNTVSANFGRGEDDAASELMTKLEDEGHSLVQKKWVEPMTLKAVVKEQVEKGTDLPLEAFNVYVGQKIKVKK
jgi:hypothetical protein